MGSGGETHREAGVASKPALPIYGGLWGFGKQRGCAVVTYLQSYWLSVGRGVSGPPPGPLEGLRPMSGESHTATGPAGATEEWPGQAQPSWVRHLSPSQLSLPTALGGGDPLEFRFRLLWPRAGGESGAGVQLVLCAVPFSVTRAGCSSGLGASAGPGSPPGDGAA